jgi:hypothetical protein
MTFIEFCGNFGVTKAEVGPLLEYWCLLRLRGVRRYLTEARRSAR